MTIKGIYKLVSTPDLFLRDYIKKNPSSKKRFKLYGERFININLPIHQYYYLLFLFLNKGSFFYLAEESLKKAISLKAKAIYYYKLGILLKRKKQWWQIVEAFSKAIEISRKEADSSWYREYALALSQMNRDDEAKKAWEKSLRLSRSVNADDWFLYGYACEKSGNQKEASEAYNKAINLDKNKNAKKYGIGIFFEKKGMWIQAKESYCKTIQDKPLDADLIYRYGLSLDRCYEWEEAERQYLKALTLNPKKIDWYYRLGFVRERQKKYEKAAEAYQYAADKREKHTPYWYYRLGYVLNKNKEYKKSVEAFLMMKNIVLSEQADDNFFTVNKIEYIQDNLDRLKTILNQDTSRNDLWHQLARAYESIDEYEKAQYSYERLIERKNNFDGSLYFILGKMLAFQGKYKEAVNAFIEQEILHHSNLINSKKYLENKKFKLRTDYAEYYERYKIEEKTVLFESFKGEHFSDNPYAIFKYMLNHPEFKDWKFIWILSDKSHMPDKYLKLKNLIIVKRETDLYLRYLSKSKILINNTQFPYYYIKKTGQIYVNTWHGTPWKTLGIDNPYQNGNTARNFMQADFLISPNKHTSHVLIDRYGIKGLFNGELLEIGYPRIDGMIKITDEDKDRIKKKLGINDNKPVILYAPTYKGLWSDPSIESDETIDNIEKMKNEKYHLLFRGHYFIERKLDEIGFDNTIIARHDIDTCELLSIVDVLITDYSSIMFDYLPTNKPIILFAPDYIHYKEDRGLYLDKKEVPGYFIDNSDQLSTVIEHTIKEPQKFIADQEKFKNLYAKYEDGNASERLIDNLLKRLNCENISSKDKSRQDILVYLGTIENMNDVNKIKNYLKEYTKNDIALHLFFNKIELVSNKDILNAVENIKNIQGKIEYSGTPIHLLEESWFVNKINSGYIEINKNNETIFNKYYQREFKRLFSNQNFSDIVILNKNNDFLGKILQNNKQNKRRK